MTDDHWKQDIPELNFSVMEKAVNTFVHVFVLFLIKLMNFKQSFSTLSLWDIVFRTFEVKNECSFGRMLYLVLAIRTANGAEVKNSSTQTVDELGSWIKEDI